MEWHEQIYCMYKKTLRCRDRRCLLIQCNFDYSAYQISSKSVLITLYFPGKLSNVCVFSVDRFLWPLKSLHRHKSHSHPPIHPWQKLPYTVQQFWVSKDTSTCALYEAGIQPPTLQQMVHRAAPETGQNPLNFQWMSKNASNVLQQFPAIVQVLAEWLIWV